MNKVFNVPGQASQPSLEDLEKPDMPKEVEDWALVVARLRTLKMSPLDANQMIDKHVEDKRTAKKEMNAKIEMATPNDTARYT